jgi:ribonuclease P protein component
VTVKGTLKTRRQFRRVYEQGSKAVGRHLVAFALSVADPSDAAHAPAARERPLVGYVASRKAGGSTQRNRAKRLLRAAFAGLRPRVSPGWWLVLVARQGLASPDVRSPQVQAELETLLRDLGVLCGPEDPAPSGGET